MREKSEGSGEWCTDIRVLLQLLENVDLSSGGRAELVGLRLADAFSADVYYLRGELAARPTLHNATHRAAHSAAYRIRVHCAQWVVTPDGKGSVA